MYPEGFRPEISHYHNLGHIVRSLIHVGAHQAEEILAYAHQLKVNNILLFEPNPDKYEVIKSAINYIQKIYPVNIVFYSLGLGSCRATRKLTSFEGKSSGLASLLEPKMDQIQSHFSLDRTELGKYGGGIDRPTLVHNVYTTTLDATIKRHPEFIDSELLVVDTQGSELEVLKGSQHLLALGKLKSIDLEVTINSDGISAFYEKNPTVMECNSYLAPYGYEPDPNVSSFWGKNREGKLWAGNLWQYQNSGQKLDKSKFLHGRLLYRKKAHEGDD